MKILVYSFCIFILFASGFCRRNCDNYAVSSIRGPLQEYFGAYKPGNWWVYQNKSRTKTDSIYVVDYSDKMIQNLTTCLEYEQRTFTIKNNILTSGSDLYVIASSTEVSTDFNFSLIKYQTQSGGFPQFIHDERYKELWSFPSPDNQGQNEFDSVIINAVTYRNVLQGKYGNSTYYFSKGKGLVGWVTNSESFNLTNYKIL